MITTLDDFDQRSDGFSIRILDRDMSRAEARGIAEQHALETHPVVQYVLNLPVEPASYPANRYLRFANRVQGGGADVDLQESVTVQESPQLYTDPVGNILTGDQLRDRLDSQVRERITWGMPGHDDLRPKQKHCGFIRSSDKMSVVYTACPSDYSHHFKAKMHHCWSLRCPRCMNDTAIKRAVELEKKLLSYACLEQKEGNRVGRVAHFVVSPPQEFFKSAIQSFEPYDVSMKYIESELMRCGATAGLSIMHPWRQVSGSSGSYWEFSPHVHCILYGFIDTDSFRKANPGWVIKKIHPRERIRSVRHTIAYLLTHAGQGIVETEPEDVDWDLDFLNHMIPGVKNPGSSYTERDYEDLGRGKGRMAGDLSDMDWLDWTEQRLCRELRTRTWGGASRRSIVRIDNYRQYRIRVCRECGSILHTYDGFSDHMGQYVRYIADSPIVCFARNAANVRQFFQRYKSSLPEGVTLADLALMVPTALCTLELPGQKTDDLVMPGPFAEPDSYFLSRQRKAFGADTTFA